MHVDGGFQSKLSLVWKITMDCPNVSRGSDVQYFGGGNSRCMNSPIEIKHLIHGWKEVIWTEHKDGISPRRATEFEIGPSVLRCTDIPFPFISNDTVEDILVIESCDRSQIISEGSILFRNAHPSVSTACRV